MPFHKFPFGTIDFFLIFNVKHWHVSKLHFPFSDDGVSSFAHLKTLTIHCWKMDRVHILQKHFVVHQHQNEWLWDLESSKIVCFIIHIENTIENSCSCKADFQWKQTQLTRMHCTMQLFSKFAMLSICNVFFTETLIGKNEGTLFQKDPHELQMQWHLLPNFGSFSFNNTMWLCNLHTKWLVNQLVCIYAHEYGTFHVFVHKYNWCQLWNTSNFANNAQILSNFVCSIVDLELSRFSQKHVNRKGKIHLHMQKVELMTVSTWKWMKQLQFCLIEDFSHPKIKNWPQETMDSGKAICSAETVTLLLWTDLCLNHFQNIWIFQSMQFVVAFCMNSMQKWQTHMIDLIVSEKQIE